MTKTKKSLLVAGAAALGLVAATGVTSGLAWFATNSTVTVTGMAVTANTTDAYLLIAEGDVDPDTETEGVRALNDTSVASSLGNVSVKPTTYTASTTAANLTIDNIEGTHTEGENENQKTVYNWGTASSDDVTQSSTANTVVRNIERSTNPTGTFATDIAGSGKYVSVATFSVCLATGSANCTGLRVSAVDIKNGANPVADSVWNTTGLTLIIATDDGGYKYTATDGSVSDNVIWNHQMTAADDTSVLIKAYVYIDGTSAGVTTAAVANLKGTVGFSISTVTA